MPKVLDAVWCAIDELRAIVLSLEADQLLQLHQFDVKCILVVLVLSGDDLIEIKECFVLKNTNHGIFVFLVAERLLSIMHQE